MPIRFANLFFNYWAQPLALLLIEYRRILHVTQEFKTFNISRAKNSWNADKII